MKAGKVRAFAFVSVLLASLAVGGASVYADETSAYVVENKTPNFTLEEPIKLQVKVFDKTRREIRNARVIFEIVPAGEPPPFGHDAEMSHAAHMAASGGPTVPEEHKYMHDLHQMKVVADKAIHKVATFDAETGFYVAPHVFSRWTWHVRVYVAGSDGRLQRATTFTVRVHCEYFDVTNIELVKTYLHQLAAAAAKQDWPSAKRKLGEIEASARGKHGLYYMRKNHHGLDISEFEQQFSQLKKSVEQASAQPAAEKVRGLLDIADRYEKDFAVVEVKAAPASDRPNRYEIKVWDRINNLGVARALVVVQEQYNLDQEATNPAIVPFLPPDQGLYHAKVADLPRGTLASEVGNGIYAFESKDFASSDRPKRIFVYYHLDRPGVPSKFITKEINVGRGG